MSMGYTAAGAAALPACPLASALLYAARPAGVGRARGGLAQAAREAEAKTPALDALFLLIRKGATEAELRSRPHDRRMLRSHEAAGAACSKTGGDNRRPE